MTGRLQGQTINDRLLAARHSLAGQGLAKSVCKATTEEMIGPKKKHLDYLVHCTNEPNVSIPQLANLLIERSQNTNWVVVYKALVTVHHMMCYGNERFTQYLASSNSTFQLSNFLDKSGVQGILQPRAGYDMSPFIRRYAKYLNEKALSYRTVAFDFCKIKRGKEDGLLRTMNADKLLKTVPVLQNQLDALLEFDCSANDLTNGVINMSFMLLFRDLIRLFACYNDGIINLLEKFFDMNKKQCKEALDIYKKFLIRMDKVGEFLKVAENVGIDKGDIPDLTKAPSSLLDALEQHFNSMEGKKSASGSSHPLSSSSNSTIANSNNQKNVKSGVSVLSSTSNAFVNVATNGRFDNIPAANNGIVDEHLKLRILAEEEAAMNQFKSKLSPTSATNNPFLSNNSTLPTIPSPAVVAAPEVDLFAANPIPTTASSSKALDDLLQLSNPFVDDFAPSQNSSNGPTVVAAPAFIPVHQPHPQPNNVWMTNGNAFTVPAAPSVINTNSSFVSENNFASVFGNQDRKANNFDALGGVLQPINANNNFQTNTSVSTSNNNIYMNNNNNNNQQQVNGLLTGDLESSLASLAENLTINNRTPTVKGVQWNSPKNGSKNGANVVWSPQPVSDLTGAGYKPMNQSMLMMQQQKSTSPFSSMTTTHVTSSPQTASSIYPPLVGVRPMVGANHGMMSAIPAMTQVNQGLSQNQSLLFH